jgi:hypothetical protein
MPRIRPIILLPLISLVAVVGVAWALALGAPEARADDSEDDEVNICHWSVSQGKYREITVYDDGDYKHDSLNTHEQHEDDIIPAPIDGCPDGEDGTPAATISPVTTGTPAGTKTAAVTKTATYGKKTRTPTQTAATNTPAATDTPGGEATSTPTPAGTVTVTVTGTPETTSSGGSNRATRTRTSTSVPEPTEVNEVAGVQQGGAPPPAGDPPPPSSGQSPTATGSPAGLPLAGESGPGAERRALAQAALILGATGAAMLGITIYRRRQAG